MSSILARIQEIAANEGITITALERKIGASKGVLSRAITNGTDIQTKWIQNIVENYPQYSPAWLLTGIGPMILKEKYGRDLVSEPEPTYTYNRKNDLDNSLIYRMYKEKEEENKELLKEIGRLEERLKNNESSGPIAKDVSIENSSSKKRTAISVSVQSKK